MKNKFNGDIMLLSDFIKFILPLEDIVTGIKKGTFCLHLLTVMWFHCVFLLRKKIF